jgi:hypothetical protein
MQKARTPKGTGLMPEKIRLKCVWDCLNAEG